MASVAHKRKNKCHGVVQQHGQPTHGVSSDKPAHVGGNGRAHPTSDSADALSDELRSQSPEHMRYVDSISQHEKFNRMLSRGSLLRAPRNKIGGNSSNDAAPLQLGDEDRHATRDVRYFAGMDGSSGLSQEFREQGIPLSILKHMLGKEIGELIRKELLGQDMRELLRAEFQTALKPSTPVVSAAQTPRQTPRQELPPAEAVKGMHGSGPNFDLYTQEASVKQRIVQTAIAESHEWDRKSPQDDMDQYPSWMRHVFQKCDRCFSKLGVDEAPNQPWRLKRFLEGYLWGALVNKMIILNCVFMVYSLDYEVKHYTEVVTVGSFRFWCEMIFLCFFGFEFGLKIACYGLFYFHGINWKSNILDFVLLVSNVQSIVFAIVFSTNRRVQNFTWLRLLRILRLMKAFRILRMTSYVKTLRAILNSILNSFTNLLWSLTMLAIVFFIFGVIFVSRVATHLQSMGEDLDPQWHARLTESYGSVGLAMQSLVMISFGGIEWGEHYFLFEAAGALDQVIFLFVVMFIHVALLNIILGIFVEDAMKNLLPDNFTKAHELAVEDKLLEQELRELCREFDENGNGRLSSSEWDKSMRDGRMRELLGLMGFPVHHVHQFFHMIRTNPSASSDQVDDTVICDEFVKGCMRMRGLSTNFDLNAVLFEIVSLKDMLLKQQQGSASDREYRRKVNMSYRHL